MDRRRFCKIAALAAGSIALDSFSARGNNVRGTAGIKGHATVIRRECYEDLQSLYLDDPERGACSLFTPGEQFNLSAGCPEGFCPLAWESIKLAVEAAAHCPDNPGEKGVIITSCPDGTRPVIFRIDTH